MSKAVRSIIEYMPEPPPAAEDLQLVQAKVDKELFEKANKARKEDGYLWKDIFEAAMKKYLEERKR